MGTWISLGSASIGVVRRLRRQRERKANPATGPPGLASWPRGRDRRGGRNRGSGGRLTGSAVCDGQRGHADALFKKSWPANHEFG
jgi:hypothetical protein